MKILQSNVRFTPVFILSGASLLGVMITVWVIFLALSQPWLGMTLRPNIEQNTLDIARIHPNGPSQILAESGTLVWIVGPEGEPVNLVANDKIEEPDAFPDFQTIIDFMDKQTVLDTILRSGTIQVEVLLPNGDAILEVINPAKRPVFDMPAVFWAQILVAVAGLLIGPWIFLLRQNLPAALFAIAGVGLSVSAASAALYSSRELAINGEFFWILSGLNHCGATVFGGAMIALFLSYPRQVVAPRYLLLVLLISASWQSVELLRVGPLGPATFHLLTLVQMLTIVIGIGIQFFITRGDPRSRAVLRWLGLSVIIGAGAFVLMRVTPLMFGLNPVISQGYAFLFFLLIYIGLALGIARYRLFDLDEWAFRILFYLGGAALLLILDAALIFMVALEELPAFGLAILSVAFLYLPLRDIFARRFVRRGGTQTRELFNNVVDIAYAPTNEERLEEWQALMDRLFKPLKSVFLEKPENAMSSDQANRAQLLEEGLILTLPAIKSIPPLTLEFAHNGRKLFTPRELVLAQELVAMLQHAIENRFAHESGVAQERERIARDIHDNIGAQLLSALHSSRVERKDTMIRETLTDLRDIINNASEENLSFDESLADLRVETAERLSSDGVALEWRTDARHAPVLSSHVTHAIRSVIREAVSNVIKHAAADKMSININYQDATIFLVFADDGRGFQAEEAGTGSGLGNMRSRISGLSGTFEIAPGALGTQITVSIPVRSTGEKP